MRGGRPTFQVQTVNPAVSTHADLFARLSWRRLALIDLGAVVVIAGVTGLAVHVLTRGFGLGADGYGIAHSVVPPFVYTAIMLNMQLASGYLALRYLPLRTFRHGVTHVSIQALTTLASFVLATVVNFAVLGLLDLSAGARPAPGVLGIVAAVAFLASLICNTVFYLFLFYRRAQASERVALEAQLGALRAQINPHFLFNSLNSIAALIRIRPQEAESVTEDLAELFRYSLRASHAPVVTLEDEIASAELYLSIERARFGDRMRVSVDVPERLRSAAVPSLIVQPLVENAVKHGISGTDGDCEIRVSATEVEGTVTLRVTDDGPGFLVATRDEVLARGTGLRNVRQRLELHFGQRAHFRLRPDGVELSFPMLPHPEAASPGSVVATRGMMRDV
jgi:two-component sensor histidine kinase